MKEGEDGWPHQKQLGNAGETVVPSGPMSIYPQCVYVDVVDIRDGNNLMVNFFTSYTLTHVTDSLTHVTPFGSFQSHLNAT